MKTILMLLMVIFAGCTQSLVEAPEKIYCVPTFDNELAIKAFKSCMDGERDYTRVCREEAIKLATTSQTCYNTWDGEEAIRINPYNN